MLCFSRDSISPLDMTVSRFQDAKESERSFGNTAVENFLIVGGGINILDVEKSQYILVKSKFMKTYGEVDIGWWSTRNFIPS